MASILLWSGMSSLPCKCISFSPWQSTRQFRRKSPPVALTRPLWSWNPALPGHAKRLPSEMECSQVRRAFLAVLSSPTKAASFPWWHWAGSRAFQIQRPYQQTHRGSRPMLSVSCLHVPFKVAELGWPGSGLGGRRWKRKRGRTRWEKHKRKIIAHYGVLSIINIDRTVAAKTPTHLAILHCKKDYHARPRREIPNIMMAA